MYVLVRVLVMPVYARPHPGWNMHLISKLRVSFRFPDRFRLVLLCNRIQSLDTSRCLSSPDLTWDTVHSGRQKLPLTPAAAVSVERVNAGIGRAVMRRGPGEACDLQREEEGRLWNAIWKASSGGNRSAGRSSRRWSWSVYGCAWRLVVCGRAGPGCVT